MYAIQCVISYMDNLTLYYRNNVCLLHGSCMVNGSVDVWRAIARVRAPHCQSNHKTGHFSIENTMYIFKSCTCDYPKMVSKTWFCPILSY